MRISEIKTFFVSESIEAPHEVKFVNRAGAWDVIQCTKARTEEFKTDPIIYGSKDHYRVAAVPSSKSVTYYSQWYESRYFEWLKDLLLSPLVYINGKYHKLEPASYSYDKDEDLYRFELKVSTKYQENFIRL